MKKLVKIIAVGLLVLPFAALSGCCSKCKPKHHHCGEHHHKVEKMRYECGDGK